MLPQLVRRGHSVKVILASGGKLDHPAYEIDGVCVEPLRSEFLEKYKGCFERWAGLDVFYYMLPVAWAAWAQAQENFDYDLVEATDWALLFAPWVASPKKAPVVISLHGSCGQVDWYSHTGGERSLGGDLVRMAEVVAMRGADAIHANSRMNADFWRARTGCEVTVIPPASEGGGTLNRNLTTENTEATEEAEEKAETLKSEKLKGSIGEEAGLRLASQAGAAFSNPSISKLARDCENTSLSRSAISPASLPATGYSPPATAPEARGLVVGRLQNWKGAEVLCQALRLVPEIRVEWLGADTNWDGRGTLASEYLARNYPDVWGSRLAWLGQVDRGEVAKKIRDAAFLVVPSLWDVFNLTAAEAMEAGVPVVCSRGAGAEMLIGQGRSGFLFEPGNSRELAECLRLVSSMDANNRGEIACCAKDDVARTMDSARILEMLETSYTATLKKGFCPIADEWLKNLFAPGPRQPSPAPAGLVKRAIRKTGRILRNV
jgi:glycosyltransferase involved in cell wall biosynthesis